MTSSKPTLDLEDRPTLPSIHTLNLPFPPRPKQTHVKYQNHNNLICSPLNHHGRQVSTSSSRTSASRTISPSPSPPFNDADSEINNSNSHTDTKFRLVPCPLDIADAVILVPAPHAYPTPNLPNYVPRSGHGQGLLLVGTALQQIRQPHRQLAKGARIHPYRVVRGENNTPTQNSRRSSIISITSFSHTV